MMNAMIVKVLAVGLTLSQLFTKPNEEFKAHFDPNADQAQVSTLLGEGCKFITGEFKTENIDFDFLFTMMIGNAETDRADAERRAKEAAASGQEIQEKSVTDKIFEEMDLPAMQAAYKTFCKGETVPNSPIKLNEVIDFYNNAMAGLPDHSSLKGKRLPQASILLDSNGKKFTEVYSDEGRRRWVSIKDLPAYVKDSFVAAEDKRFFQHNGLDVRGIIRAFSNNLMGSGRPEGGSTITQQVVKNLVVGDDVTFERKMKEMVIARRVESLLSKDEILELYINFVFLGRASWGIEMAAQSYFGKSAKQLSVPEAAFLAGLTKGPNYYHADRHADRALERRQYVLGRLKDDGYITEAEWTAAKEEKVQITAYDPPKTTGGFFFIDELNRRAKEVAGVPSLTSGSYKVYSTMHPQLQKAAEKALLDGLFKYEVDSGRVEFAGPEGSIAKDIQDTGKTWQEILPGKRAKLFDVQWSLAVVVQPRTNKSSKVTVGLADGRTAVLSGPKSHLASLQLNDLVYVNLITEGETLKAQLRNPVTVQGSAIVIENKTGRVLAMTGGSSFAASQLNRVTQTYRQTGSTLKPFIYLAAFSTKYFQPTTLVYNTAPILPPLRSGERRWHPKNYSGGGPEVVNLRQAVERSLNLPTVRVMAALGETPGEGLDYTRNIIQQLGIYDSTDRRYPFILGAQPARLIDLAYAYATVANLGQKPKPHFIDAIEQDGRLLYERRRFDYESVPSVDKVAFYQMRRVLEGTLPRGTAVSIKDLTGYVAGKTGTSNDENDAWFVGFTNDITVAVWVGYDSRKIRPSLGSGFTGGKTALPIARAIFDESFKLYKDKEPLAGAPEDIQGLIEERVIEGANTKLPGGFLEVLRLDGPGGIPRISAGNDSDQFMPEEGANEEDFEQVPAMDAEDRVRFPTTIIDQDDDLF